MAMTTRMMKPAAGAILSGSGNIFMWYDVVLNNPGAFVVQHDGTIARQAGQPRFNNTGTFLKSAGVGTTTVSVAFDNSGTVEVRAGTLAFSGGGTHTGDFSGARTLALAGGTHTLESASSVTVSDVVFSFGTTDVHGIYDLVGNSTTAQRRSGHRPRRGP